jgi:anthranilate phosphoribosyltransferase
MHEYLDELIEQRTLSSDSARKLLTSIASGQCSDSVVAAFLTVFRMRALTLDELTGFRLALIDLCVKVDLAEFYPIDLCGSGGDHKNTFNISTTAAFIVAGAGIKVAKHGNNGASSNSGSSNVIEALGAKFTNDQGKLKSLLEQAGVCYLHAPLFHPAMKNIAHIRRELGIRTFLNMLGPLVNPCSPKKQLIGSATAELARLYGYFLQSGHCDYCVVHCLNGYDEFSLTGKARILTKQGEAIIIPEYFGLNRVSAEALHGGTSAAENAKILVDILSGQSTPEKRAVAECNAALAIRLERPSLSLIDALEQARESIESKRALASLRKFVELSAQ